MIEKVILSRVEVDYKRHMDVREQSAWQSLVLVGNITIIIIVSRICVCWPNIFWAWS